MRRFNSLLLNLVVIAGLGLGTVPLALSASATSQRTGTASAGPTSAATPAMASKRGKHKREHRQNHRQHQRKADRKHHGNQTKRKRHRNQQDRKRARQARELQTGVLPGADTAAPPPGQPISAQDHYIILLRQGTGDERAAAEAIAAGTDGVVPTHVYQYVFSGFAAFIPPGKLAAVRADPRVQAVVPDQVVNLETQTLPTGIDRIDADQNPTAHIDGNDERVDVDVAVVDTAGNDSHPDLNVWAWGNCTPSHNNSDDNGHGTHVGGIIGALDNNVGVVGVAPGARLWNIRVLVNGHGLNSWIICGLDLVTKYATDQGDGFGDIEVANVSIGGSGTDSNCATDPTDLYHQAYCRAVNAGVTIAVAAGNEHTNANTKVPAAYDEVITVSALADYDGKPGGLDPTNTRGPDDSLATFSNFGADVDIAAPGVGILSTVPTGSCSLCDPSGYTKLDGTSMASPHVAGAAALYLATHPGASPATVKAAILAARSNIHLPGDTDGFDEGVLFVGAGSGIGAAAVARESSRPADAVAAEAAPASDAPKRGKRQGKAKAPQHQLDAHGRHSGQRENPGRHR